MLQLSHLSKLHVHFVRWNDFHFSGWREIACMNGTLWRTMITKRNFKLGVNSFLLLFILSLISMVWQIERYKCRIFGFNYWWSGMLCGTCVYTCSLWWFKGLPKDVAIFSCFSWLVLHLCYFRFLLQSSLLFFQFSTGHYVAI